MDNQDKDFMGYFESIFGSPFGSGKFQESKEELTNKYIKGVITKEEYFKRMKNAR